MDVALLLPGQGAQHLGMAVELYGADRVFTDTVDELFDAMGERGSTLRAEWLAADPELALDDASRAQPLLFTTAYAVGRSLREHGVHPAVMLGHSVGELAAAALGGVFTATEAAALLVARDAATARAPHGGMVAVSASVAEIAEYLDESDDLQGVVVGARNAPRQTVIAGPEPRLTQVVDALAAAGFAGRRVPARQPFHSPSMRAAAAAFEEALAGCRLRPPSIPIMSTRTARLVEPREAVDPAFWAGQLTSPVLFWPALEALLGAGPRLVVETGPGQTLSLLARRHPQVRRGVSAVRPALSAGRDGALNSWTAARTILTAAEPVSHSVKDGVTPF